MTKDDLVFLGGQFHFSIGRDGKIEQASFMARVGVKAPDTIPLEHRDAVESKRVENVEIRISKMSLILDPAISGLVLDAKNLALSRFVPPVAPVDPGGKVI